MRARRSHRIERLPSWVLAPLAGFFTFNVWFFGRLPARFADAVVEQIDRQGLTLPLVLQAVLLLLLAAFALANGVGAGLIGKSLRKKLRLG